MRRRALAVRTDPAHSGQVEVTSLHSGSERRPLLRSEGQPRPVRVLGIAHRDGAGQVPARSRLRNCRDLCGQAPRGTTRRNPTCPAPGRSVGDSWTLLRLAGSDIKIYRLTRNMAGSAGGGEGNRGDGADVRVGELGRAV